ARDAIVGGMVAGMKHPAPCNPLVPRSQGVALPTPARRRLLALIKREGEAAALQKLRIARPTLARCLAGLPVHRATVECVSRRLEETAEAPEAPGRARSGGRVPGRARRPPRRSAREAPGAHLRAAVRHLEAEPDRLQERVPRRLRPRGFREL